MSEYQVELFAEKGFARKKCPLCGKNFWTLGERKTCGEPPCEEYSFIGDPPTKKAFSLSEMREKYLSFFEKNGHTRIPRYPIIARWRNDIFFTIASVSCFQPWVLNGTIDPPANPLVMSQTCVRFNDIDNVGKTGRHLTEFEMMAHHAFNTKENQVYFKDRTVELCHDLLMDLGVSPEDVQYLEAEWAGGGNSGPCFEVIVRGVELATLVFMMYEDSPSGRKEMDMQVVDTGYGLERFAWISQGTPNAYEAIFGDVLSKLKSELRLEPDEDVLSNYSRLAGMMNVESNADLKVLRRKLAERMGASVEQIIATVSPFEHLYAVCDHTRALMFMLNDGGIVPSNVKAGYFARLLARRTLRSIKALKLDIPLSEVVGMQIDYFSADFPELKENRDDIVELASVEEEKYAKTVSRGRNIVAKLDADLREENKKALGLEDLINLYDSQGLNPELVAEFSALEVNVPDDFYIKVSQRHESAEEEEEKEKDSISVSGVAPTALGFYEDAYVNEFSAKVFKVVDNHIVLDKTYFYPEGGGQEADRGSIGDLSVVDVQKSGGVILHKVEGDTSSLREGETVSCRLDWNRRKQLMQHHTVTHIINGAARRVLGNHAWQTGAHKSEVLGRLDLTHHSAVSDDERKRIEEIANKVVSESRPVKISFLDRDDAEKRFGFRIYQGGAVPGKTLRIVDIEDWDVEACGGMHFSKTSEVGSIKITDSRRIQDGVVRLEYKAGCALDSHAEKVGELSGLIGADLSEDELKEISSIFSVQVAQLPKTLERFKHEWKDQAYEIERLGGPSCPEMPPCDSASGCRRLFEDWKIQKKEIARLREKAGKELADEIEGRWKEGFSLFGSVKAVKVSVSGFDVKSLSELAKSSTVAGGLLIIVNKIDKKANVVVCSKSDLSAAEVAGKLSRLLGGGAHGSAELAVGGGSSEGADDVLDGFEA